MSWFVDSFKGVNHIVDLYMGEDFNLRYILYTDLSSHNYIGKSNESSRKGMSPRQVEGFCLLILLLGIETDVWSVWIFKFWATKQFLVMQHNIMLHWSLFGWMRSWKMKKNYFFIRRITKRIRLTCKVISTKWTNCIESIEDYQLLNGFSMIMPDSLLKIFKAALYRICISNSGKLKHQTIFWNAQRCTHSKQRH